MDNVFFACIKRWKILGRVLRHTVIKRSQAIDIWYWVACIFQTLFKLKWHFIVLITNIESTNCQSNVVFEIEGRQNKTKRFFYLDDGLKCGCTFSALFIHWINHANKRKVHSHWFLCEIKLQSCYIASLAISKFET